jgi:hypothetical protein
MLSCPECGGFMTVETSQLGLADSVVAVTPEAVAGQNSVAHLPDDVDRYFSDAAKILRAGVPDAAAVQLRRTLEAAAAHYKIDERTLVKSIEKLIEQGHVTKSFGGALHHIRQVGNVGAHASDERLDDATVQRAFRFTAALLRDLFEVPAELAALQAESPAPSAVQ